MSNEYLIAQGGYLDEFIPYDNNIINQGLVQVDASSDFRKGGFTKETIFRQSLRDLGIANTFITEGTTITPDALGSYKVITPVISTGYGISESDFVAIKQGTTAENIIVPKVREVVLLEREFQQANLKLCIDGAFKSGGALATTHQNTDNLTGNSGRFSLTLFQSAITALFGEKKNDLTKIVTNQLVVDELVRLGIASYQDTPQATEAGVGIATSGAVPRLLGMEIIVNDVLCPVETITEVQALPMYVLGGQPFGLELQSEFKIASQFKADKDQGTTEYYFYNNYGLGIKGLSWVGAAPSAFSGLSTAANWTKKWNDRNIKLFKYVVGAV
jgi:hypothetical protein